MSSHRKAFQINTYAHVSNAPADGFPPAGFIFFNKICHSKFDKVLMGV